MFEAIVPRDIPDAEFQRVDALVEQVRQQVQKQIANGDFGYGVVLTLCGVLLGDFGVLCRDDARFEQAIQIVGQAARVLRDHSLATERAAAGTH